MTQAATADQAQEHVVSESEVKRAVAAAGLGNALEWFDFGIYSYMAATIGYVFFPSESGTASLIGSFAVFAIAFVARPLGAFISARSATRSGATRCWPIPSS